MWRIFSLKSLCYIIRVFIFLDLIPYLLYTKHFLMLKMTCFMGSLICLSANAGLFFPECGIFRWFRSNLCWKAFMLSLNKKKVLDPIISVYTILSSISLDCECYSDVLYVMHPIHFSHDSCRKILENYLWQSFWVLHFLRILFSVLSLLLYLFVRYFITSGYLENESLRINNKPMSFRWA